MGLFDAFKKKQCDVCGGEISMMSNKKLKDGNMCKTCEGKLSRWFGGRRNATVAQIKEQLAYREANKAKVDAFDVTRTFGQGRKLLVDEEKFLFSVSGEENPDVLSFEDLTDCTVDVHGRSVEKKYWDKENNYVSYSPPRHTWYYDFDVVLQVKHPYFSTMRIQMNAKSVCVEDNGFRFDPEGNANYVSCKEMADQARGYMLQMRQNMQHRALAASAPKKAVVCPNCRATTTPDASGCCEYCGSAI